MERIINAKVEPGQVALHWLGQSGYAIKAHAGDRILVDPYLSDNANSDGGNPRLKSSPVRARDVEIDYLFLTHDHSDHTDPHTAPVIMQNNANAIVVGPPSVINHLAKLGVGAAQMVTAMPGQALEFAHFTVHPVAAHHSEDSVGYVFEFNESGSNTDGPTVYLTGDTEYAPSLAQAVADFGVDVLICPIAGPRNLDMAGAAKLTAEIAPREVIPCHYGLFDTIDADPDVFAGLISAASAHGDTIIPVVMGHNSCHVYRPNDIDQGRHAHKKARAARAETARQGREHRDGIRGPNGGSGIARGGGRTH